MDVDLVDIRRSETVSDLERLPSELADSVFDYVPEAVSNLRLASRSVHGRIEEYALGKDVVPLIDEVKISPVVDERMVKTGEVKIDVSFRAANLMKLFYLRLLVRKLPLEHLTKVLYLKYTRYEIELKPNKQDLLGKVCESMGKRVQRAFIDGCSTPEEYSAVCKVLNGLQFPRFRIHIDTLYINNIMDLIRANGVDELSLSVKNINTLDHGALMLELSTLLSALHIRQIFDRDVADTSRYFIGAVDSDWAPIFVEMLSNKLDKLCILNDHYSGYLGNACVDELRERLPSLNKQIWFSTTCDVYPNTISFETNEHSVDITSNEDQWYLTIKHTSRLNEPNYK